MVLLYTFNKVVPGGYIQSGEYRYIYPSGTKVVNPRNQVFQPYEFDIKEITYNDIPRHVSKQNSYPSSELKPVGAFFTVLDGNEKPEKIVIDKWSVKDTFVFAPSDNKYPYYFWQNGVLLRYETVIRFDDTTYIDSETPFEIILMRLNYKTTNETGQAFQDNPSSFFNMLVGCTNDAYSFTIRQIENLWNDLRSDQKKLFIKNNKLNELTSGSGENQDDSHDETEKKEDDKDEKEDDKDKEKEEDDSIEIEGKIRDVTMGSPESPNFKPEVSSRKVSPQTSPQVSSRKVTPQASPQKASPQTSPQNK